MLIGTRYETSSWPGEGNLDWQDTSHVDTNQCRKVAGEKQSASGGWARWVAMPAAQGGALCAGSGGESANGGARKEGIRSGNGAGRVRRYQEERERFVGVVGRRALEAPIRSARLSRKRKQRDGRHKRHRD